MKSGLFGIMSLAFVFCSACQSMNKPSHDSAMAGAENSESMAQKVREYRDIVTNYPATFGQQVRAAELDRARSSAETMYNTLSTLETSKEIASQVCFGGTEWACKNFRNYMSQDIKALYDGFVLANSLSTGDLLKIATKIETVAEMDYKVRASH